MIIPFPQEAVTCCSNGSFRLFIPLTQVMCLFAPLYLYPFPSGIGHLLTTSSVVIPYPVVIPFPQVYTLLYHDPMPHLWFSSEPTPF